MSSYMLVSSPCFMAILGAQVHHEVCTSVCGKRGTRKNALFGNDQRVEVCGTLVECVAKHKLGFDNLNSSIDFGKDLTQIAEHITGAVMAAFGTRRKRRSKQPTRNKAEKLSKGAEELSTIEAGNDLLNSRDVAVANTHDELVEAEQRSSARDDISNWTTIRHVVAEEDEEEGEESMNQVESQTDDGNSQMQGQQSPAIDTNNGSDQTWLSAQTGGTENQRNHSCVSGAVTEAGTTEDQIEQQSKSRKTIENPLGEKQDEFGLNHIDHRTHQSIDMGLVRNRQTVTECVGSIGVSTSGAGMASIPDQASTSEASSATMQQNTIVPSARRPSEEDESPVEGLGHMPEQSDEVDAIGEANLPEGVIEILEKLHGKLEAAKSLIAMPPRQALGTPATLKDYRVADLQRETKKISRRVRLRKGLSERSLAAGYRRFSGTSTNIYMSDKRPRKDDLRRYLKQFEVEDSKKVRQAVDDGDHHIQVGLLAPQLTRLQLLSCLSSWENSKESFKRLTEAVKVLVEASVHHQEQQCSVLKELLDFICTKDDWMTHTICCYEDESKLSRSAVQFLSQTYPEPCALMYTRKRVSVADEVVDNVQTESKKSRTSLQNASSTADESTVPTQPAVVSTYTLSGTEKVTSQSSERFASAGHGSDHVSVSTGISTATFESEAPASNGSSPRDGLTEDIAVFDVCLPAIDSVNASDPIWHNNAYEDMSWEWDHATLSSGQTNDTSARPTSEWNYAMFSKPTFLNWCPTDFSEWDVAVWSYEDINNRSTLAGRSDWGQSSLTRSDSVACALLPISPRQDPIHQTAAARNLTNSNATTASGLYVQSFEHCGIDIDYAGNVQAGPNVPVSATNTQLQQVLVNDTSQSVVQVPYFKVPAQQPGCGQHVPHQMVSIRDTTE